MERVATTEASNLRPDEAVRAVPSEQGVGLLEEGVLAGALGLADVVEDVLEADVEGFVLQVLGPDGRPLDGAVLLGNIRNNVDLRVGGHTGNAVATSSDLELALVRVLLVLDGELHIGFAVAAEKLLGGQRALDLLILRVGLDLQLVLRVVAGPLELSLLGKREVGLHVVLDGQLGTILAGLDLGGEGLEIIPGGRVIITTFFEFEKLYNSQYQKFLTFRVFCEVSKEAHDK